MARNFDHTVPQFGEVTAAPVLFVPITISCWVRFTLKPSSGKRAFTYYGDTGSSSSLFAFYIDSGGKLHAWASFVGVDIATAGDFSDGLWHHCAWGMHEGGGMFPFKHRFWVDGVQEGLSATSAGGFSFFDTVAVGELRDSTPGSPFSGDVAEYGIIAQQSLLNRMVTLSKGVNLRHVYGTDLKFHAPLWGLSSPEPDLSGAGKDLVLTGGPTRTNHPPVVPFTPKWAATAPVIETGASTRRVYLDDVLISVSA